jgi:plasmid stability protein
MKSITIHNLDDSLDALIQEKAREEGLSLNRAVKMLLRKALGLEPGGNGDRRAGFAEFCGVWSKADAAEFERNTKDLRKVDPRDWQQ